MKTHKWLFSLLGIMLITMISSVLCIAAESDPTKEQFIPVMTYKTGPFAAGGSGVAGGYEDYMALLNLRDGGINGVKFVWEECDF